MTHQFKLTELAKLCAGSGEFMVFLTLLLPALRTDLGGSYSVYGTLGTVNFVGYLFGTLALPLMLAQARQRLALNLFASCAMSVTLFASGWSFMLCQIGARLGSSFLREKSYVIAPPKGDKAGKETAHVQ